jgi:hypothetical protein
MDVGPDEEDLPSYSVTPELALLIARGGEMIQFVSPQQELEDHQGEGEYEPPGFHPKFCLTLLIRWLKHTSPPPGAVKDPRYPSPESS